MPCLLCGTRLLAHNHPTASRHGFFITSQKPRPAGLHVIETEMGHELLYFWRLSAALTEETVNGTRKLKKTLAAICALIGSRRITSYWLAVVRMMPTTSAIGIFRLRTLALKT